jgi:hypothetical protein
MYFDEDELAKKRKRGERKNNKIRKRDFENYIILLTGVTVIFQLAYAGPEMLE